MASLSYSAWSATADTLHAHTQVLGKIAVTLAPPAPELQHAALRLTARGWETALLPAVDGGLVVGLDLHAHEAFAEHSDGSSVRVPLTPDQPVAEVTNGLLGAVRGMGTPIEINTKPQEVAWTVPLDEDYEHATYDTAQVAEYFAAAAQAALVLAEFRAPYRGRSTPVNAWWGSFDLSVNLFSGLPAKPPSDDFIMRNSMDAQEVAVGWWPGDPRHDGAAYFAYAHPAPDGYGGADLGPAGAHWDDGLGLYMLEWEDVIRADDPHATALEFARSAFKHACVVCDWDPGLPASAEGDPPPVV